MKSFSGYSCIVSSIVTEKVTRKLYWKTGNPSVNIVPISFAKFPHIISNFGTINQIKLLHCKIT